ncbi:MAG TPA: metallophosphoesterase, partial [Thermoanaerobaculia bacterium]|nr:metallophosphoesterase [Thermoanaerobaculia bacterium]
ANDGSTHVWYSMLEAREEGLNVELLPLVYDYESLAVEMRRESLPEEFVETVMTGWWTTCLEILPARERAASRY